MKKILLKISIFFFCFLFVFVSFPFPDVSATTSWDNLIYALKTNLGIVSADNGTLSGIDNNTFYGSLYETTLYWDNSAFVPAETFSSKAEWIKTCSDRGNPDVIGFHDFDIVQSLEQSGYISVSDGNYDFSNFPKLGNSVNTSSPLDGIEVITNFSSFNPQFSSLKRPYSVEQTFNSFKNSFLSLDNRLTIISTNDSSNYYRNYFFISPNPNVDFFGFYFDNTTNAYKAYCHHSTYKVWNSFFYFPEILALYPAYTGNDAIRRASQNNNYFSSNLSFSDFDSSVFSASNNSSGYIQNNDLSFWSNVPVVIGSNDTVLQNYYSWLYGSPSGQIYTTSNTTNNVYSQEFIENNDWQEIYNNYVTDVSNYYSTTENITNENLSQYIDQSTTITNITNNYITNNIGGGDSGDDIITNSWLERIYQKLVEIKSILLGRGDPDDNSDYITDNGIKNDILHYPAADLFPDVPVEDFISDADDFTLDLFASKLSAVISEAIPFCYIYILGDIADSIKATPVAPYWEIPFQIDRIGIDENLVLDLTSSDWNNVHTVWITLFMILFISYLFYLSYRIVLLVSNLFA